jgi:hypothetical protein
LYAGIVSGLKGSKETVSKLLILKKMMHNCLMETKKGEGTRRTHAFTSGPARRQVTVCLLPNGDTD